MRRVVIASSMLLIGAAAIWMYHSAASIPVILSNVAAASQKSDTAQPAGSKKAAGPVEASETISRFQIDPNYRIELVASEPAVIDPIAISFDEDGRMWVVEMGDYPNGPPKGQPPLSRIRILEDRDRDGKFETSTLFADKLLFATGVQPWKGGAIVTLAGEVAYMKDTNGDGKGDFRETWFTGFVEENPQLRANHPTFGPDNHIYVANGLRGGSVVAWKPEWKKKGAKPVSISGMDFRFNPLTGTHEAVSGIGQFGLTFDDFGNQFFCSNRDPCNQVMLENRYLKRNPFLGVRAVFEQVSPAGENSKVYPISQTWTTSNLHQGQFTAACGVKIYLGNRLPELRGNSFTCEPTGNLVHRDILTRTGSTFTAKYAYDQREFLSTKDEWFRPVNLQNGPDGNLYIVDMYRAVIEHPQFVPDELKNRPDARYGDDRGRIYRIVPAKDAKLKPQNSRSSAQAFPRLSQLKTNDLVPLLGHANGWHRTTAARLIYERQDKSVVPLLRKLIADRSTLPQGRYQALWALNGLDSVTAADIAQALNDPMPRVQEAAVILAEPFLTKNETIRNHVLKLATSEDARLRFQIALSLGETNASGETADALAKIAVLGASDDWTRRAVLSSSTDQALPLLTRLEGELNRVGRTAHHRLPQLFEETAELIGARPSQSDSVAAMKLLLRLSNSETSNESKSATNTAAKEINLPFRCALGGWNGLGRGLARRGIGLGTALASLPETDRPTVRSLWSRLRELASNEKLMTEARKDGIQLLKFAPATESLPTLRELAAKSENAPIQLAAISTLAGLDDPSIGPLLLKLYPLQTPTIRRGLIDAMLANPKRTALLLDEVAAKRFKTTEFDPTRINQMMKHRDPQIRARASKLLASALPADRQSVLKKYEVSLTMSSDALRGRTVFQKNCTACHRIGDLGVNVAPDISDSRTQTPSKLLVSILDPNRAIDNNYFSYTIVTLDGIVHTGIISAETATSVTLRQQENKTVTILRSEIEELRNNGISLMPVGLEKNINPQEMADLISFIKNWRYLSGKIPIKID